MGAIPSAPRLFSLTSSQSILMFVSIILPSASAPDWPVRWLTKCRTKGLRGQSVVFFVCQTFFVFVRFCLISFVCLFKHISKHLASSAGVQVQKWETSAGKFEQKKASRTKSVAIEVENGEA
jgi:hypothetical protein